ncbi:MAG: hypothetical protein ACYDDU_09255 [Dermatophilaceae bacterium]
MRAMRIAADTVQLALPDVVPDPVDRWSELPETTRGQVLTLLSVLIARGVLVDEPADVAVEVCDE